MLFPLTYHFFIVMATGLPGWKNFKELLIRVLKEVVLNWNGMILTSQRFVRMIIAVFCRSSSHQSCYYFAQYNIQTVSQKSPSKCARYGNRPTFSNQQTGIRSAESAYVLMKILSIFGKEYLWSFSICGSQRLNFLFKGSLQKTWLEM